MQMCFLKGEIRKIVMEVSCDCKHEDFVISLAKATLIRKEKTKELPLNLDIGGKKLEIIMDTSALEKGIYYLFVTYSINEETLIKRLEVVVK